MEAAPIEIVLFDLGGVLIEFRGVSSMGELAGIESDDELWRRWLGCPWVRSFERGRCSAEDFATGMVSEWDLRIGPQEFLSAFTSWPRGPLPGAEALVRSVGEKVPAGCLSNTNALHWEVGLSRWPTILDAFDFRFLSHELGMLKPDPEVFDHVARVLPARPSRVLFLDDNVVNVDAAADAGFAAAHVNGVADANQALVTAGVLSPM